MIFSRSVLVIIVALTCGCAAAQTPAPSAVPLNVAVNVVNGQRQRIDYISVLHPDCTPGGYVTVRVITPPAHGELTTEQGIDYPTYPKENQRYKCNLNKVPLLNIYYKANPGYVGMDTATIEWISPIIPVAKTSIFTITVR